MKFFYFFIIFFISSCITAPPIQEMSDARQAISVADQKLSHLPTNSRISLSAARDLLIEAENHLRSGRYDEARSLAITAKEAASDILEMAISISNQEDLNR